MHTYRRRELGIAITGYGVLSRGLISGHWQKNAAGAGDFRAHSPRFQGENADRNLALVDRPCAQIAEAKGVSVAPGGDCLGGGAGQRISFRWWVRGERDQLDEALGGSA